MLRQFRVELLRRVHEAGYTDARDPHMQVFGNIDRRGTRLTDLAARANMTRPSMAELVDDLEAKGYLERRSDPDDRRAKLICLTSSGRQAVCTALLNVKEIEEDYARRVGEQRYEEMCRTLQDLLDDLTQEDPRPSANDQA
jgi:DNA-binding MarR family transcriptional regulator